MNEKEMEDLIAEHPDEFFSSRKKLVFVSRQQSLDNAGRLDLRFQDEFKRTVVMELKAVVLKFDHADQVAKYYDELKRRESKTVVMWLVAPRVPTPVGEFLDNQGILWNEIHFGEFRRIAQLHDYVFKSEQAPQEPRSPKGSKEILKTVVEIGELFLDVLAQKRYIAAGYKSFVEYVEKERVYSKSQAYQSMRIVRKLIRVPKPLAKEDVNKMPRKNAEQLITLKKAGGKLTPQIIADAINMTEAEFRKQMTVGDDQEKGEDYA